MKTVMKKMFSLLLVAVLLVGVMPFAAFADETPTNCGNPEHTAEEYYITKYESTENVPATCDETGTQIWRCHTKDGHSNPYGHTFSTVIPVLGHKAGAAATCDTPQECTVCGEDLAPALGHLAGPAATCTTAQTCTRCDYVYANADPNNHAWNEGTITTPATCSAVGKKTLTCTLNPAHTTEVDAPIDSTAHEWDDGVVTTPATHTATGVMTYTCELNAQHTKTETIEKLTGHTFVNGTCACGLCQACNNNPCVCVTVIVKNELKNTTVTDTYKPGDKVTLGEPAWVDGYNPLGWTLQGSSSLLGSSYTVLSSDAGRTITIVAKYDKTTTLTQYPVSVYARLKIGDQVQDVDRIHYHGTLLANDKILDYLKHPDTLADIRNTIATKYKGYSWSGNFHNAYGDTAATDNITVVDGSKSVYINLYAEQDDVRLYVYTDADCEDYELLYELDGYKANSVNDTVTSADVLSFLKGKLGSGISIKMFDEAGFNGYWRGKENTSTNYVAVKDGTTKVYVRVYNAYSSSSSSKADSSNPKTGDAIFAPMMVLGASASALAVLFYLNKKRAY